MPPKHQHSVALPSFTVTFDDDEPRVLDTDLAAALGMAQPLNIRATIERNREELECFGPIHTVREMVLVGSGARRAVSAFYLNEEQALTLCAMGRTQRAKEVRGMLIKVFVAYRRGELVTAERHSLRLNRACPCESSQGPVQAVSLKWC